MNPTNGMIAGMYNGWYAFRDSNGYAKGQQTDPDNVAHNTTTHAYRLKYPVSYGLPNETRVRATRQGAQRVRGSRDLGLSDLGQFPITLDGFDEQFDAFVKATSVDTTTNTGVVLSAPNSGLITPPRGILGLSTGLTDEDGVDWFLTYIWNNVQITKPSSEASSQNGGTNPNPLEYTVIPEISDRTGIGLLYGDTALAVVDDEDLFVRIRARWQYTLTTFIADGSTDTFNLGYLPKSDDETGADGNFITKNGAITAVTSVSKTTGAVALAAAGSDFDIWQVCYPTSYKAA